MTDRPQRMVTLAGPQLTGKHGRMGMLSPDRLISFWLRDGGLAALAPWVGWYGKAVHLTPRGGPQSAPALPATPRLVECGGASIFRADVRRTMLGRTERAVVGHGASLTKKCPIRLAFVCGSWWAFPARSAARAREMASVCVDQAGVLSTATVDRRMLVERSGTGASAEMALSTACWSARTARRSRRQPPA